MSKKDIIYKSGLEEISKRGFFNTKVQHIVENANVSVGTFYNYYSDKSDFLYAVFLDAFSKLHNVMKHIQSIEVSEVEKIIMIFDLIVSEGTNESLAMSIIFCERQYIPKILNSESYNNVKYLEDASSEIFSLIIKEGQKKNLIKKIEPDFIIMLINSFITSFLFENSNYSSINVLVDMKKFILDSIIEKGE